MQGYDLTILVKVTTKPAHYSEYGQFMDVRDGIKTALDKLVKTGKVHEGAKIEQLDPANVELVEKICETIDAKVDAKITALRDELRDEIRDVRSELP